MWKIDGKRIEYLLVKKNLNVSSQNSLRIIFHILYDMGLPCSKRNNSNLLKESNIIFAVSKRCLNISKYKMN